MLTRSFFHVVLDGIFDTRVWSVASAFFLTGKDNGSIALIDMTNKEDPGNFECNIFILIFKEFYYNNLKFQGAFKEEWMCCW